MKGRILLVSSSFEDETRILTHADMFYPLGLGYLHSYLEHCDYNVQTLFLNGYPFKDCYERTIQTIDEYKPNMIGFQVITNNRVSTYRLIESIHEKYPDIHIVLGGIHSTLMYQQLLERYPFLTVVIGEGEITFSELAEKLINNNTNLENVDGIAFHNNGVIKTKDRELIENLDILPFPKHEAFFDQNRRIGSIITARGCPFKCSFCCLDNVSKRRIRYRSVDNVVDEIEYLHKKFPKMRDICIHDDTFFMDNQRAIKICEEIIRRKIKLNFSCSGRIKPISKELIAALEKAGFTRVLLGLESGSSRVLRQTHKGITKEDAINAIKLFSNSCLNVQLFMITGLPGEDINTVKETCQFIQKLQKIRYIRLGGFPILWVYPGTEIYEKAKAAGMIDDNYWLTDKPVPFYTAENTIEELNHFNDIIAKNIDMQRIFTLSGFLAQITLFPYIIKYIYLRKTKKLRR
ncbi:MAG: hypothetical protein A2104_00395 [Candidatus Melainabacteria bacterium GWF2_32_7]|nr:MAG: hypothetical protein A2104_00395 [Candidatus Melainabacteria bacterium GWF2_32_7]